MKRAFTLVELLVVIAILCLLMAVILPAMRVVREQGRETVCRSNLRQLAIVLKTYTQDNNSLFPPPYYLYHSRESFGPKYKAYFICCRWHDARIGLDSALLRYEHPELRGVLWPYLGNNRILLCQVGQRANVQRGCNNACPLCVHDPRIDVVPQYTYTMNAFLGRTITTAALKTGLLNDGVDPHTTRQTDVFKETQVTRSPSDVFLFGEQNSWAVNIEGQQPLHARPDWAADYDLSGKGYLSGDLGTIGLSALDILTTFRLVGGALMRDDVLIGDAFATYHRPPKGDLNAGHSFVVMLDGHVQKVTVADQLRRSRQIPRLGESRLGPGGNLALAWPLDVPPPGGWENQ